MTQDLKKLCQKRSCLYKKYLQHPTQYRENVYKRYRNYVTLKIRQAKSKFYYDKFNNIKNNAKKTWQCINRLLGKNKNKSTCIESVKLNGETVTDKEVIANAFNEFFATIGCKLSSQQTSTSNIKFDSYLKDPVSQSIYLKPIEPSEIIHVDIVSKMKNDTSSGPDSVSVKVVKKVIRLPVICETLSQIFNCSMFTGVVPDQMKIACVTPIYKKGDDNELNNYRPISVLPIFTKILERCIHTTELLPFWKNLKFFTVNNLGSDGGTPHLLLYWN